MTVYILSTMTGGVSYTYYNHENETEQGADGKEVQPKGLPVARRQVRIAGGAGLPSLSSGWGENHKDDQGYPMWTPSGVVTPISDDAFEALKNHKQFQKHLEGGYLKVVNSDITGNYKAVDKYVGTMKQGDGASQLTPDSVKKRIMGTTPSVRTGESGDTWGESSPNRIKG